MSRRLSKRRRYEYGEEPWYLRDYGGVPGWGLIVAGVVLLGLAVTIVAALVT